MAKVFIIVVVILAALFIWIAFRGIMVVTRGSGVTVKAAAASDMPEHSVRVTMRLIGTQKSYKVTEISMPRDLAQRLGARTPQGFAEQALPLDERLKNNAESMKFVEDYNRTTLRWVGEFSLVPGQEVSLLIPAESPQAGSGKISFVYAWNGPVLGGVTSFFTAELTNQ